MNSKNHLIKTCCVILTTNFFWLISQAKLMVKWLSRRVSLLE